MKSYQYILELLLAGAGSLLWLTILAIDVFGFGWISLEYEHLTSLSDGLIIAFLVIVFPFVLVGGIITDRFGDIVFERLFDEKLLEKHFEKDETKYHRAKTKVFCESDNLKELYDYGRMRSRICRNWTINSIMLLLALNYLIWSREIVDDHTDFKISIFFSFILGISTVISFLTWKALINKEYWFVKKEMEILDEFREDQVS